MKINPDPPGLISRRFFAADLGRVVVEEVWNIETLGCPLIRNPWMTGMGQMGPTVVRQVVLTYEEFAEAGISPFPLSTAR